MLMLTRRIGESISARMPDGALLTITVAEIREGQVKLGFEAPREIEIHRAEVWAKIAAEEGGA